MNVHADRLALLPEYVSTAAASRRVGAVLVLAAALSWASAGYELGEVRTIAAIQNGASLEPAERAAHGYAGLLLTTAQVLCTALVFALFVPWLHQARCNLRALGVRRLRFRREWVYLGFLIPVLNAIRPYQVMSEVWRGSDASDDDPVAWKGQPTPPLLIAWWGTLLGWVVLELLAALAVQSASGLGGIELAHALGLLASVCAAVSASLGTFLVARVSRSQDEKWRARGGARDPGPVSFARREIPA